MFKISLLTLIGLPGAGKTTFARWLLENQEMPFYIVHVCYDDLLELTNDSTEMTNKEQRMKIIKILENIFKANKQKEQDEESKSLFNLINSNQQAENLLKFFNSTSITKKDDNDDDDGGEESVNLSNKNNNLKSHKLLLICDDNHYYRSMRYKLYQLCREYQHGYAQIYFENDLEFALHRNAIRDSKQKLPNYIIEQMHERLQEPNLKENNWEEMSLNLNSKNIDYEMQFNMILNFILSTFENIPLPIPIQEPNETKKLECSNPSNQLDILLRRRINELLSSDSSKATKQERQQKFITLNTKRLDLLKEFRKNKSAVSFQSSDFDSYVNLLN